MKNILFGLFVLLTIASSLSFAAESSSRSDVLKKFADEEPLTIQAPSAKIKKKKAIVPKVTTPEKSQEKKMPEKNMPEKNMIEAQVQLLNYANSHLRHLRYNQRNCYDCYVTFAGDENSTLEVSDAKRACIDKWTDFYKKEPLDPKNPDGPKKPVDVRIVLGHLDSDVNTFVNDGVMRQQMVNAMTEPCSDDGLVQVCDFVRSATDMDVFEKEVYGPTGEMQTVRVTLTASVATGSEKITKAKQAAQSERAARVFYDGLDEADMLLYVGHGRFTSGPDFGPAVRRPNGTTDKEYYLRETPGTSIKAVYAALEKSRVDGKHRTPKILGFLACDAENWRAGLERAAPQSGLLLTATDKFQFDTILGLAYLALDSVLWQRCAGEFDRAMNTLDKYYGKERPLPPVKLRRFYPGK